MDRTCETCSSGLLIARADARYCSTACRMKAYRHRKRRALPESMTSQNHWVRHDANKVPLSAVGGPASSTDPQTWCSYQDAAQSTIGVGVGFVLGGGIGCIDLDHCITGGKLEPWAAEIVAQHRDSAILIERSRSGEGVHIFTEMDTGRGRVVRDGRNIETYPPDSGRYIAVTGDRL